MANVFISYSSEQQVFATNRSRYTVVPRAFLLEAMVKAAR